MEKLKEKILGWLLSKVFVKAFGQIEKTDWMTAVLKQCFKNKLIRSTWKSFCLSVREMLQDAEMECESALDWNIED